MRRKRAAEARKSPVSQIPMFPGSSAEVKSAKNYRIVSVSLYVDQAEFVDRTAEALLRAGFAKANRSFVIQTALECLRKDLEGKSPVQIVTNVLEHQGRRPPAIAASRTARRSMATLSRRPETSRLAR